MWKTDQETFLLWTVIGFDFPDRMAWLESFAFLDSFLGRAFLFLYWIWTIYHSPLLLLSFIPNPTPPPFSKLWVHTWLPPCYIAQWLLFFFFFNKKKKEKTRKKKIGGFGMQLTWIPVMFLNSPVILGRFLNTSVLLVFSSAAAAAKSRQSCPTWCDPRDGSPPGSAVPGILQGKSTGVGCHCLLRFSHLEWG